MRNLIARLFLTVGVLLGSAGMSFALPECDGSPLELTSLSEISEWDNCEGTFIVDPSVSKFGGYKYVGEFRNGIKHGHFTVTYGNGANYVGEFRNGKKHGQGTATHANGDKYVGEYRNGKKHGQGTYTYADGAKYVGEYRNDKRNGRGTFTFPNGSKYVGEYRNGERNGHFTVTYPNGANYVGEFRNGKKHGQGTYTYAKGAKYVGEYRNGKKHGQGTYTFASGNKYVGEFRNGKRNGRGTFTYASGRIKEGIWKDDKFQYTQSAQKATPPKEASGNENQGENFNLCSWALLGDLSGWDYTQGNEKFISAAQSKGLTVNKCRAIVNGNSLPTQTAKPFRRRPCPENGYKHNCFGTYTYASGSKYVGEYRNNKRNGHFTVTYANGDKYVGEYRNGKKHGQGTYTYAKGEKYVGEFKDGNYHGQGTYTFASGNKYVGEYRNGERNGHFTVTYADGAKYVGEYRNGKKHGQGTYTFASGNKYVGEFRNGKRNGRGTFTYASGRIKEGIWKDDKFQYTQKVTPPTEAPGNGTQGVIEYAIRLTGLERCRASNSYWSDCLNVYQRGQNGNIYGNIVGWWLQYYVQNQIERTIKISGSATIQSLPKQALMSLDPSRSSPPTRIAKPKPPKVIEPVPTYANLSDPRLCKKALNSSRASWDRSEKYKPYSNAAKRRGLTIKYCRLVLGISKPKAPVQVAKPITKIKPQYVPIGAGSGFSITKQGHILTNHHVVKNCKAVFVHLKQKKIKKAVIIAQDKQNDLALLKARFTPEAVYSISQINPQELDDIIVAGFPLSGTLSSTVKMTRGIVSSLAGVRNDYSRIQIDAAVQPGNSGGPIINPNGMVVAVAVSILEKEYFRKKSGIIPENTNFGIKASVVRNFLEANEVVLSTHSVNTEISRTSIKDLVKRAVVRKLIKGGTHLLSCWSTRAAQQKLAKGRRSTINVNPATYEKIQGILK